MPERTAQQLQRLVSTYDPVSDKIEDGCYWRARQVCANMREAVAVVRQMEAEGYDRDVSILVERVPQGWRGGG